MIGKLITRRLTDYRYDAQSKKIVLEPDMAESWESTPDFKTWTFKLKDGLKFEDGTPVTSKDFKYGIERSFGAGPVRGCAVRQGVPRLPRLQGPVRPGR